MYQPSKVLNSTAEIKAILGPDFDNQTNKIIDHVDAHCRAWIERSPLLTVSSCNAAGHVDISPKGDPPGFVKVLDRKTLAIPVRIGNHRGDTFINVLENPHVGLMFTVPKRREVVRVSGTAQVIADPDILAQMEVNRHRPDLALLVRVEEAFFHCGKSMIRSRVWQPDEWGSIEDLPTYAQALKDHGDRPDPLSELAHKMARDETHRLY
jgi:PPOX class probable FMN-dependent enzyme